ncbi:MAG TPA: carbohydrate kinase family protein [Spirochaetia bacterium]|nr:carbohydrate kinase family protein [Spirochaetia bacterium]
MKKKIKISGTGCALGDYLYAGINFSGPVFKKYLSKSPGSGGLEPGKLVFVTELEKYTGMTFYNLLKEITGAKKPSSFNIGGPGIVALIHAAQILYDKNAIVSFYGYYGNDTTGYDINCILSYTPLETSHYCKNRNPSPYTYVLSDPNFDNGNGERIFINHPGAAEFYTIKNLDNNFWNSDIITFGGTALVPDIHENLGLLLFKGKQKGCVTVVHTVYDFPSEYLHPGEKWKLGKTDCYNQIDLLIMDKEEAFGYTGKKSLEESLNCLIAKGPGAIILSDGAGPVHLYSDGRLFQKLSHVRMPVSAAVRDDMDIACRKECDTTGCGDNFAGGVIASLAQQLQDRKPGTLNLAEACAMGIASGAFACFYFGGTYREKKRGEKQQKVYSFYQRYREQVKSTEIESLLDTQYLR